jgi:hypothetical protein
MTMISCGFHIARRNAEVRNVTDGTMGRWIHRCLKAEHALTEKGDAVQKGLMCAWCGKLLETEDFAVELVFPAVNEAMKRETLKTLPVAVAEVMVGARAIGVLCRFCCEPHKSDFIRMAKAEGVRILKQNQLFQKS